MERTYSQIDMDERRKIARWKTAGISVNVIAEKLGRHRSTIFRELRRNAFEDSTMDDLNGYYCVTAHEMARDRRTKLRKLARFSELRQAIIDQIMHGWSPQQIAGRLQLEGQKHCVSHETIYKFAYSSDGQAIKLWRHLPELVAVRDMPDAIMAAASARKSIVSTARRLWQNASNSVTGSAISSSFGRSSAKPT